MFDRKHRYASRRQTAHCAAAIGLKCGWAWTQAQPKASHLSLQPAQRHQTSRCLPSTGQPLSRGWIQRAEECLHRFPIEKPHPAKMQGQARPAWVVLPGWRSLREARARCRLAFQTAIWELTFSYSEQALSRPRWFGRRQKFVPIQRKVDQVCWRGLSCSMVFRIDVWGIVGSEHERPASGFTCTSQYCFQCRTELNLV